MQLMCADAKGVNSRRFHSALLLCSALLAATAPPAASREPGPGSLIRSATWEDHSEYYPRSPLCESDEVTLWSCQADDQEHALCSSREMTSIGAHGYMQYRALRGGSTVVVHPEAKQPPAGLFAFRASSNGDAAVEFMRGDSRYVLVDALRGESAVLVDPPDGPTTRIACGSNQTLQVNYTLRLMHEAGIWAPAAEVAARARAAVDAAILPLMSEHDVPGMAVGVIIDGEPHVFTYGVASKETGAPVTEATLFEIGSVSKVFTATLAAYAQATGKLSLGDHPGQYLPELKGRPVDQATLLHLGTYTAGGFPLQFPSEVADDSAVMDYFHGWEPSAPPGTRRDYSNPSPGLLGLVTASAMDGDFAALMQSTVFSAFGMADTFIHVPDERMADYAWGYRDGRPVRVSPGPLAEQAYGVKTTVSDLVRFVLGHIDPGPLEPTMRRAVEVTQGGYFRAGPVEQGLGWERYPQAVSREWLLGGNAREMAFEPQPAHRVAGQGGEGRYFFNKTGSTGGFGAYVAFVPAENFGVVLLANRGFPNAARIEAAWQIREQLASDSGAD